MIIIATHAIFLDNKDIFGSPHRISAFLNKKKKDHIFIKHRLDGNGYSRVEYYTGGQRVKIEERGCSKKLNFILRYLLELALNIKITTQEAKNCEIFIGIDPLNSLSGNILKFIDKTKRSIFFSVDFSLKRFNNSLLNATYLWLDKSAMFWSDQTISVSDRIVKYRDEKGLPKSKNILLPNSPFQNDIKIQPLGKINKYDLVIVTGLEEYIAFDLLINTVEKLRKKIGRIKLIIIGSGSKEHEIKKMIKEKKLGKCIRLLTGISHNDVLKILSKSGIGIALYEVANSKSYRYFCDPMKVREYLACGLPVIISGNTSLGYEVRKKRAGFLVRLKEDEIADSIEKIIKNRDLYLEMRNNAIKIANNCNALNLFEKYLNLEKPVLKR